MSRDWDDLRYFLALAREGTVRRAAASLRVTHSTVSRRISALEEKMGARLFEKRPDGYVPTLAGEHMVTYAERLEENIAEMELAVQGVDAAPTGIVRVATIELLMLGLAPIFEAFRQAHPGITLEIHTGHRIVDLGLRESDTAIRLTNRPSQSLVGRRIGSMNIAPYAAWAYLQAQPPGTPISELSWVSWAPGMLQHATAQLVERNVPPENIGLRISGGTSQYASVLAGAGVGFINCFIADQDPRLRRVLDPDPEHGLGCWVVTHEDLRATARVRLFLDFMYKALGDKKDLIEGREPQYPTWADKWS